MIEYGGRAMLRSLGYMGVCCVTHLKCLRMPEMCWRYQQKGAAILIFHTLWVILYYQESLCNRDGACYLKRGNANWPYFLLIILSWIILLSGCIWLLLFLAWFIINIMKFLQNAPFRTISALRSDFNPRNIKYIPVVKIFTRLDLEWNWAFFKGL